jgi:hypothetical protein
MITNLLATIVVTLVTNTTERVPQKYFDGGCPDGIIGCLVIHQPGYRDDPDAKERWVKTVVTQSTKARFNYDGLPYEVTLYETNLSNVEIHYVLERTEKWKPEEVKEASLNPLLKATNWGNPGAIGLTNLVFTNLPGHWEYLTNHLK